MLYYVHVVKSYMLKVCQILWVTFARFALGENFSAADVMCKILEFILIINKILYFYLGVCQPCTEVCHAG